MLYFEVLLLAVGLSMDSLAVSVAGGAVIRRCTFGNVTKIAGVLGVFQAGMTAAGYLAGVGFEKYICDFDHWIAFFLLAYLGGKMIYDGYRKAIGEGSRFDPLNVRTLMGLGVATSIDALAVGVSLAILRSPLLIEAFIIGMVTFGFSAFGVYFGNRFGNKLNLRIELIGGVMLIGIGVKILLEHTLLT